MGEGGAEGWFGTFLYGAINIVPRCLSGVSITVGALLPRV